MSPSATPVSTVPVSTAPVSTAPVSTAPAAPPVPDPPDAGGLDPDRLRDPAALQGGRRRSLELADGSLSLLEWDGPSADAPLLVWLHATGFHALTYRGLLLDLARDFRVVAPDLRGHGDSTLPARPGQGPVHRLYAADVEALLQHLGAPALVAGHSLGTIIGMNLAARRPELVRALALVEPVLLPPGRLLGFAAIRALGLGVRMVPIARTASRRRAVFPSRAAMLQAYTGRGAFRTWPARTLADYVAGGARERPDGQVELACSPAWEAATFAGYPLGIWRSIARIRCPVTMLRGEIRSTAPAVAAARFCRLVPQAREVVRPRASHFLPQEEPDLVTAEIRALAGIGRN